MSKNCGFFVLLLIPAILTLVLLSFSISVDWWIDIKKTELTEYQAKSVKEFENFKEANIDDAQTNINYFYIEKLWPFTTRFGLYSKCVEYKRLYLKLSNSFITTNKNSIIKSSLIHYPKYIISNSNQSKPCDSANQVRCYYNNQCVVGKRFVKQTLTIFSIFISFVFLILFKAVIVSSIVLINPMSNFVMLTRVTNTKIISNSIVTPSVGCLRKYAVNKSRCV